MKHHPHHADYNVLSCGQAKVEPGEEFRPGYTAGSLATQVLAAVMKQERPWSRIECDDANLDDEEDFALPLPTEPAISYSQYYRHGINRFI